MRFHKKFDDDTINCIINDYSDNNFTYREIIAKYKVNNATLVKILKHENTNSADKIKKRCKIYKKHSVETKKKISIKRIEWLKNNPDNHVWKRNDKFKSIPCEHLKDILIKNSFNFIEEFNPLDNKSYSIDIAFPIEKIGLEVNGNQHYNNDGSLKKYYYDRKIEIENTGWKLYDIHYTKVYKQEFIDNLIINLNQYNLVNLDLSFYIINKKDRLKEKNDIKKERDILKKEKIDKIIDKIKNSDIDFTKYGWVKSASNIIGISSNKGSSWIKRNMTDLYDTVCIKRKVIYKNSLMYDVNTKLCLNCGNVIIFKNRFNKFCSLNCSSSYNNKNRNK